MNNPPPEATALLAHLNNRRSTRPTQLPGSWALIHRIDRLLQDKVDDEELDLRYELARQELKTQPSAEMKQLAHLLDERGKGAHPATPHVTRARLAIASEVIDARNDLRYETAASWERRMTWLMMAACLGVAGVSYFMQTPWVALLGAVGGLIGRTRRMLTLKSRGASDYGLSWSMLFVAVPVGALLASAGLYFIGFLVDTDLVGPHFDGVCSAVGYQCASTTAAAAAAGSRLSLIAAVLALAFGISESLFNRSADAAIAALDPVKPTAAADQTATTDQT